MQKFIGLLSLAALPCVLQAQAALRGRAVNDTSGAPIESAEIVVEGTSLIAKTDANGWFILGGVPPKTSSVLVRCVGYRPVRIRLVAFGGKDTVDVVARMTEAVVELPPVEVTASSAPPGLDDFAERRALGFGSFIDWTILRSSEHRRVSDVLARVPGIKFQRIEGSKLVATGRGLPASLVPIRYRRSSNPNSPGTLSGCPMSVWLDGILIFEPALAGGDPKEDLGGKEPPGVNDLNVSQLDAIEIYSGSELPSRFRTPGSACGAILFWTRRR